MSTVFPGDPDYWRAHVFLDGVQQALCRAASEEEGWVDMFVLDPDHPPPPPTEGMPLMNGLLKSDAHGKPLVERKRGHVQIVINEGATSDERPRLLA